MPIRDDSAGSYGTWNNDELSWLDLVKAKASDGGNALANLGRNLAQGFSPIGTSEQGNMALRVPPIVSGIAQSYGRLAGSPSQPGNAYDLTGVPELDTPIQQDMSNVLLSLYGGNAVSGLTKPKGALGAGVMKEASGLPMDHASRMARAREMGFDVDTPLYHGTRADAFDAFKPSQYGSLGEGVYLTNDPNTASGYAVPTGAVYPTYARGNFMPWEEYKGLPRSMPGESVSQSMERMKAEIQNRGYAGVEHDGLGTVAVLDPSNIRSVNAAFDPARAGENGLLLSDTGKPSILGSAMAGSGELPNGAANYRLGNLMREKAGDGENFFYDILAPDNSHFGVAQGHVKDGTMNFSFLGNEVEGGGHANALGISGIKALREQIRQDFPEVTQFTGHRSSGARNKANAENRQQTIELLSDNLPSPLGSALATAGENYDLPEWLRF